MLKFLSLAALLALSSTVQSAERVFGGEEVEPHSVPSQVLMTSGGGTSLRCGGVVYDEWNVVTAAHCCFSSFRLHGGVHYVRDFDENVQSVEVEDYIRHEDYDSSLISNDVCIVHLETPFTFNDYVQPGKYPEQDEPIVPNSMAFATGWGRITKRVSFPEVLMGVEVPVLSDEDCVESHLDEALQHDPATMICAGTGEGMGTCNGDSGGPISVDDVVVGLCSWSIKDSAGTCSVLPDNYARVATYIDWFEEHKKVPGK